MDTHLPLVASSRLDPRLSTDDDDRQKNAQTLLAVLQRSEEESRAEDWLTTQRWPAGVTCPKCSSHRIAEPLECMPLLFRRRNCTAQCSARSHCAIRALTLRPGVWPQPFHLRSVVSNPTPVGIEEVLPVVPKTAWTFSRRIDEAWALAQLELLSESKVTRPPPQAVAPVTRRIRDLAGSEHAPP